MDNQLIWSYRLNTLVPEDHNSCSKTLIFPNWPTNACGVGRQFLFTKSTVKNCFSEINTILICSNSISKVLVPISQLASLSNHPLSWFANNSFLKQPWGGGQRVGRGGAVQEVEVQGLQGRDQPHHVLRVQPQQVWDAAGVSWEWNLCICWRVACLPSRFL